MSPDTLNIGLTLVPLTTPLAKAPTRLRPLRCCSIASCLEYFELFCALLYTLLHYACISVYRSTAQRTVYLYRQELSVIDYRYCR